MRKSYSKLSIKKEEIVDEPSRPTTRLMSKTLSKSPKLYIKSEAQSPRPTCKQEAVIKNEAQSKVKVESKFYKK